LKLRWRVAPRHQLIDARLRPSLDEAGQQVGEVTLRIDAIELAGLCRTPNYAEWACFLQKSR
jgi:hypothetical protein